MSQKCCGFQPVPKSAELSSLEELLEDPQDILPEVTMIAAAWINVIGEANVAKLAMDI